MDTNQHLTKRIVFVVPYFWKLPNYFDLYLQSLAQNPHFHLLLVTDDTTIFDYPTNVRVIYMSFQNLKAKIQQKFDFAVSLDFGYKLCDYKPAFGYIFEDMIQEYDFWWCCDLDIIFGNLSRFITDDILNNYDKIFDLGHMTLYRNTHDINRAFLLPLQWKSRAQEVFQTKSFCWFDEQYDQSINSIFDEHHIKKFSTSFCADIVANISNFHLAMYSSSAKSHSIQPYVQQVFLWENGKIFRIYIKWWKIHREEFAYIHLQKRHMLYAMQDKDLIQKFLIMPNRFQRLDTEMNDTQILHKYAKRIYINKQFFVFWYDIIRNAYINYGIIWILKRSLFLILR